MKFPRGSGTRRIESWARYLWPRSIAENMQLGSPLHCHRTSGQTPDKWFLPSNHYRRIYFFASIRFGDSYSIGDALPLLAMFVLLRMDRPLNQRIITPLYLKGWQWFTTAF